ncbi:catalase [Cobetia sp. L2A1]|uniref:catalase n=1 Tax=Cobetia sp. L2A1 TaxID=2686360 RepID=UPI00131B5F95|nr:catalase [Cobetia sp. L2A1]
MLNIRFPLKTMTAVMALGLSANGLAQEEETLTRSNGAPVGNNQNSLTAGPNGPTLLQDHHLIEKLAHFDRERIPERVVHARGTGAYGEFRATEDLSDLTVAAPFQTDGKVTPVFVRFSAVIHSKHSPETLRDPRGFAVKFYSDQGNWDLVGNNFPVFFIRDAMKFPDMVHSLKPDPRTNLQDPNRFFDFFSHIPESTNMLTYVYSPLGIPTSLREMNGSGVHAFKFVNAEGDWKYVKFTWKSRQGNNGMSVAEAAKVQSTNFNHLTDDLYTHLDQGDFPIWDLYVQTIEPDQLNDFDFNPLDTTKIWPEDLIPARKVGELELNRVPDNFFQETEQAALAPSNMIPGIEPSEDRMLQGRLFSYADTQRYRLGVNHQLLPVNAPKVDVHSHNQNGAGYSAPRSGSVNYQPSRNAGGLVDDATYEYKRYTLNGTTQQQPIDKQQNFAQAGELYRSFSEQDQTFLIEALAGDLGKVKNDEIRNIMVSHFYQADHEYGERLAEQVNVDMDDVEALIEK